MSDLITPNEAAEMLGYTNKVAFLRAARNYGIPHIRFNQRRIMFSKEALNRWLQDRTIGGNKSRW
ncbi:MAG: helix-turn-helix domain-containing protein [Flavobacteriaceae bacterium]